jgi:uncharacterized protein
MSEARASLLDRLVAIITDAADPDQVILFGSRTTGRAREDSDFDFLVIVPHVENERQVSRRIYRALLDQHVGAAVDIVVVDRETLARHRDTPGMIYRRALAEGEVAYDRANA